MILLYNEQLKKITDYENNELGLWQITTMGHERKGARFFSADGSATKNHHPIR